MGRRRKAPQEPDRTNVCGAAGGFDHEAQNQIEQRGLIGAAVSTIQHFFGAFPPWMDCLQVGRPSTFVADTAGST